MASDGTINDMATKFGKLSKFMGVDFRRWQKKMHFLLTTLKVVYVLSTPRPEEKEAESVEETRERMKWDNDDYVCRGHILNAMSDELFDVYLNAESSKQLWEELEAKYVAEDASSKKFIVSNFNNYRMVNSRPVMEQFHELMTMLGQYTRHGLKMDETISVSSIIDKLPPAWKDYKHTLKHQKEEMSLEELGGHLRLEEALRMQDGGNDKIVEPTVNVVDEKASSIFKGKRKFVDGDKRSDKRTKSVCWKCGKVGHFKRDCRAGMKKKFDPMEE